MSIPQLRFLAAFDAKATNRLFFAGDLGQRIFQQPFSWASLGVDVRGRSRTLRVNYRTSHQIRAQADRLLAPQLTDVDGNVEDRRGTVSVFNGPLPIIRVFDNEEQEAAGVADWLKEQSQEQVAPNEIGIIVRSDAQVARAQRAAEMAGLLSAVLDERIEMQHGHASICTMPLAKGLEFRCVAVMACDDEVVPLNSRIENITDDSDLEEVYNTERHLLYVACTRARDALHVSAVTPASEGADRSGRRSTKVLYAALMRCEKWSNDLTAHPAYSAGLGRTRSAKASILRVK
jgi:superfamily I DNA/RNA helicase